MAMSKRAKALAIPQGVKQAVYERDERRCVYCGKTWAAYPEAHYIARSQGGLGIEQNILTLCRDCHRRYDQTCERNDMKEYFRWYLQQKYPEWDEEDLIYRKET